MPNLLYGPSHSRRQARSATFTEAGGASPEPKAKTEISPAATPPALPLPPSPAVTQALTLRTFRYSKTGRRLRGWPEKLAAAMPHLDVQVEQETPGLVFCKTKVRVTGQDVFVHNYVERVKELVEVYRGEASTPGARVSTL